MDGTKDRGDGPRRATAWDDLSAAFRLVHRAYSAAGLARPNADGMRITAFHQIPSSQVFVAGSVGAVSCTLTLVPDSESGVPMEETHGTEIAKRRAAGHRFAEVSSLAVEPGNCGSELSEMLAVMALMAQSAVYQGIDELLIGVHPHHAAFYRRFVGFEVLGEQRACPSVCGNPALPLLLDLPRLATTNPRSYRRFFGSPFPQAILVNRPLSGDIRARLQRLTDPFSQRAA